MASLQPHRDRTLDALASAYALGRLSTDSLELRVDQALRAPSPPALDATLFGLPQPRRLRAWPPGRHGWLGLQLEGGALLATEAPRADWLLGRSRSCDVRLGDDSVSRRHARVTVRGGCWSVEDLGSRNGTWVNGCSIERSVLRPGDTLALGLAAARLVRG